MSHPFRPFPDIVYAPHIITVMRFGHPAAEQRVLVKQGVKRWWIDPQSEIARAIVDGSTLSRDGCVLSFMEGLIAGGHTVILQERRRNKGWGDYPFHRSTWISYEYFLFGLAWGNACWDQLRAQLERTILPAQRLAVLVATGQYYDTYRWEHKLALRLPGL